MKFEMIKKDKDFSLALCVITKNEENFIGGCIESVIDVVDEIILVDTGSTDSTKEIAFRYGAKVIETVWEDDFSKVKNLALEYVNTDWIIFLDADERLHPEDKNKMLETISKCADNTEAILTKILNYQDVYCSVTGEIHSNYRIFKNKKSLRFVYPIHENLFNIEENRPPITVISDIRIIHLGYISFIANKRQKSKRNISILKRYLEKNPNDFFQNLNIAVEYYRLGDYEKALFHLLRIKEQFSVFNLSASRYLKFLILTYLQLGKYKEAYDIIITAKRFFANVGNFDYYFLEILWYYYQNLFLICIKKIDELIQLIKKGGENDKDIHIFNINSVIGLGEKEFKILKAECYERLKKYKEVLNLFYEVAKEQSDIHFLFANLAQVLVSLYKYDEISRLLDREYLSDIDKAVLIHTYLENRTDNEIEELIESLSNNQLKEYFKCIMFLRKGKWNEAIELAASRIKDDSNTENEEFKFFYYIAFLKLGNISSISEMFKNNKSISVIDTLINKKFINRLESNSIKNVITALKKCNQRDLIESIINNLKYYKDLKVTAETALYLYETYDKLKAIELMIHIVREGYLDYRILYILADHLKRAHEYHEAINLAEAALAINSSYVPTYILLYELYSALSLTQKVDFIIDKFCETYTGIDFNWLIENSSKYI